MIVEAAPGREVCDEAENVWKECLMADFTGLLHGGIAIEEFSVFLFGPQTEDSSLLLPKSFMGSIWPVNRGHVIKVISQSSSFVDMMRPELIWDTGKYRILQESFWHVRQGFWWPGFISIIFYSLVFWDKSLIMYPRLSLSYIPSPAVHIFNLTVFVQLQTWDIVDDWFK